MASPVRAAAPSPGFTAFYPAATSPDDIWTLGEQVVTPAHGATEATKTKPAKGVILQ